ncbi:two-component sensor histidine kinase [Paenibacillus sp. FSL H8-0548]|uniref:HAMP domain-containing sensor histidine kinase n=1 Tax=Paenibacillus sp. FSL H8-0548 TaxID=1920422 RepID=UPI00096EDE72|nr:HAMP domain-containing sensor histidine kinase [Paenibacillus sp. FSL H8-0548]OMF37831.1 two-component sensor histidine kinase [Paenibacillus sp. FSL H8-0548]
MIRSLYFRITASFLIIVLISIGVAFLFTNQMFKRDARGQLPNQMVNSIDRIEQLYAVSKPASLQEFLSEMSTLQGQSIIAVSLANRLVSVGDQSKAMMERLTYEKLARVFSGNTVRLDGFNQEEGGLPMPPAIGRMVVFGNEKWALFVQADRYPQNSNFIWTAVTLLVTLLLVGSVLILVAARYLVHPLKMMTAAATRMSKGDFSVRLPAKHGDELSELAEGMNKMALSLSQLEMMRQDFVSNVSHEIQSPLTSISGFAEALRSEDVTETERERYINIIKQESTRLSRLSENLLNLASLDSQQHPFHPHSYRLDRQLRDVVLACEPHWLAKRQTLELYMEETVIVADRDQLNQVWMNLLSNSMKFTPEGGKIFCSLAEKDGFAVVRISDTGIGISEENRERVFERFFKGDVSRNRNQGGSGLGLSIAQAIAAIHGGSIELDTSADELAGASFIIRLPLLPLGA